MRHYTKMQIGAALVGLVFIIYGITMIIDPIEMDMAPSGSMTYRHPTAGVNKVVHISKARYQVYGVFSIVLGAGTVFLALLRESE